MPIPAKELLAVSHLQREPGSSGQVPGSRSSNHFRGLAGSRLRVFVTGSTVMPAFSSAATPRIGSTPLGPKTTCATVFVLNRLALRPLINGLPLRLDSGSPELISRRHAVDSSRVDKTLQFARLSLARKTSHLDGDVDQSHSGRLY